MSYPPDDAYTVALATLATAYKDRTVGITYGGTGPPGTDGLMGQLDADIDLMQPAREELEAHADATWGARNVELGDRDVYGLILTYGRAAVYHATKKINLVLDSSMEAEAIGSSKAGEVVAFAREILRALGDPACATPTMITTDNKANLLVANKSGSAARSRHFLRRYWALQQRISSGEVRLAKIADAHMPADFLTKWLPAPKLNASVDYAVNPQATPPTPTR